MCRTLSARAKRNDISREELLDKSSWYQVPPNEYYDLARNNPTDIMVQGFFVRDKGGLAIAAKKVFYNAQSEPVVLFFKRVIN